MRGKAAPPEDEAREGTHEGHTGDRIRRRAHLRSRRTILVLRALNLDVKRLIAEGIADLDRSPLGKQTTNSTESIVYCLVGGSKDECPVSHLRQGLGNQREHSGFARPRWALDGVDSWAIDAALKCLHLTTIQWRADFPGHGIRQPGIHWRPRRRFECWCCLSERSEEPKAGGSGFQAIQAPRTTGEISIAAPRATHSLSGSDEASQSVVRLRSRP